MTRNKVVAVIPARMASSRFPNKPLADIAGIPMIEHVRRRVQIAPGVDEVVVATCDEEIRQVVESNGGKVAMTADSHERCTDRIEEASQDMDADIIVLVQGDEPLFEPEVIGKLLRPLLEDETLECSNMVSLISDKADLLDADVVKAVLSEDGYIMYLSRSPLPYRVVSNQCPLYRQTGIAAFRKYFLHAFSMLPPTALEVAESVDFLRILGYRHAIKGVVHDRVSLGVDRPQDVFKVEAALAEDPMQKALYEKVKEG